MTEILISRMLNFLAECRAIMKSAAVVVVINNIKCELRATKVLRPKTCIFQLARWSASGF